MAKAKTSDLTFRLRISRGSARLYALGGESPKCLILTRKMSEPEKQAAELFASKPELWQDWDLEKDEALVAAPVEI